MMKNLRFFIWILVPVAGFVALQIFGAPFLRWNYSWRDDGQGYDPYAPRWYLSCTYIGFTGNFAADPLNGKCPLVRFEKRGNL
jgi:hypothetical protein